MISLFSGYSVSQIIIMVVFIVLALKEALTVIDYFKDRAKHKYDEEAKEDRRLDDVLDTVNNLCDTLDDFRVSQMHLETKIDDLTTAQNLIKTDVDTIMSKQSDIEKQIGLQNDTLQLLIQSDKDQLKSFIVKEYHYFYDEKGWIDDFSMDSLNKCFEHYEKEGGNSYVHDLMDALRKLPHHP